MVRCSINGLIICLLFFFISVVNKPVAAENMNDNKSGMIQENRYTQLCNKILELMNTTVNKKKVTIDTLDLLDSTVICYDEIKKNITGKLIKIIYKDNDGTFDVSKITSYLNDNFQYISYCMADGPDGTSQVYLKNGVMLLLNGKWDGGDDSDSTYVPSTDFEFNFYIMKTMKEDSITIQLINR